MRKILISTVLVIMVLTLMSGVALAGGWTTISENLSHDPDDLWGDTGTGGPNGEAVWNAHENESLYEDYISEGGMYDNSGYESPHGGFSTKSNRCRVCHAVHMAGDDSWRLLRDGTEVNGEKRGMDRASECNYCHGQTGATEKRPYRAKDYPVLGEHTIGSTVIPDGSSSSAIANTGLMCGNCHSVHGSGTLDLATVPVETGMWGMKILRLDPNQDGNDLSSDATGAASQTEMENRFWATASNFCGDCHDQNPNWNTTEDPSGAAPSGRANGRSHVQGPTADGSLEVYGATMTVANWGSLTVGGTGNDTGTESPQNTQAGCRGCHNAPNTGNKSEEATASESAFPHQSKGAKLLFDSFTQDNATQQAALSTDGYTGLLRNDATRILPRMDQLCGKCHIEGGDIDATAGKDGVGLSF